MTCQTCLAAGYSWCNSRCQEDGNEECLQDCSQAIPRRASVVGPERPRDRRVHPAAGIRPQRARAANQRSNLAGDRPAAQNPLAGRSGPRQPLPLALTHGRWFDRQAAAAAQDPALNSLPPTSPLSTDSSRNNQSRVVRAARRARNRGPPSIEPVAALRSANPYSRANATGATAYEQQ